MNNLAQFSAAIESVPKMKMSLERRSVITIMLVQPFDGGRSVTKSIVNSLPRCSEIGSQRRNPAFASRQTVVLPQISQFRINLRIDSLNFGQNQRRKIIPAMVSLPGCPVR